MDRSSKSYGQSEVSYATFLIHPVFFCGGFFCSPAKGCKFIKRKEEEKERKEKRTEEKLGKEKGKSKRRKVTENNSEFWKGENKIRKLKNP